MKTKDKGFGTGSHGTGDPVRTDSKRQESGGEERTAVKRHKAPKAGGRRVYWR